ncbi:hypothetical protein Taro_041072 [Colocasia esculenta]|uniref:Cell division control protein 24 OB domain-containing protein n=1 Tax=Colocasia esculenta TaxID=4460 RepID=A0A843WZR6_COLES|nr:hypothetical protein [Colocasia esculenta]
MPPVQSSHSGGDGAAAIVKDRDAFLEFVDYAMSVLSREEEAQNSGGDGDGSGGGGESRGPSWSWVVSRILRSCTAYSSGVTSAILLSELFQTKWKGKRTCTEHRRDAARTVRHRHSEGGAGRPKVRYRLRRAMQTRDREQERAGRERFL